MDFDTVVTGFSALATPSRVEILRLLAREAPLEGMNSGDIAKRLEVAQNTLSTQLMMLSHARLVKYARDGRSMLYLLDRETLAGMAQFLMNDCGGEDPSTDASGQKRREIIDLQLPRRRPTGQIRPLLYPGARPSSAEEEAEKDHG
jgi:DNA-binding transcriptional ArsR family regulator